MTGRLLAVAWARFQPRTQALARDLDGRHAFVSPGGPAPLRYIRAAYTTWRLLGRERPDHVLVITPPVFAPLVAWLWCSRHRSQLVVDCHTGSFDSPRWAWARPIHRFLLRRAGAVLLHNEGDAKLVEGWGCRALRLPDDVPDRGEASRATRRGAHVMVAGSLDENEPLLETLEAARQLPEVTFAFTGDPARLPREVRAGLPANVRLTGYLAYPDFLAEMAAAEAVAVLSTESGIMNRAAFEAIGLGRPLVLTDFPGLRARFGDAALLTGNDPRAVAAALTDALRRREELANRSRRLAQSLRAERTRALAALDDILSEPPTGPRRALMVTQHSYPQASYARRNIDELLASGVHVDLVCEADSQGDAEERPRPGLRVYRVPIRRHRQLWHYPIEYAFFFTSAFLLATWLGLRYRYDVAQVDNPPDVLILTAALARLRGARVVFNMVELFPELLAARLDAGERHPLLGVARWWERIATGSADQVLTVSETCRRIIAARGTDPGSVEIIPNSLDVELPETASAPRHDLFVVTHATLIERYGIQVAIRALRILSDDWPRLQLQVVGRGEYQEVLERLVDELGLAGRVVFTGFLPWPEMMARIRQAAVGIVPVIEDGYGHLLLPTKLMEYAELRVPAAVSRLPAIREYFPEDALAYFPAGSAEGLAGQLDRLLRDPEAARAQAERAWAAMEQLRWAAVSGRYRAALGVE